MCLQPFFERPTQGQWFVGGPWSRKEWHKGNAITKHCQQMETLMEWDHPLRSPHCPDNCSLSSITVTLLNIFYIYVCIYIPHVYKSAAALPSWSYYCAWWLTVTLHWLTGTRRNRNIGNVNTFLSICTAQDAKTSAMCTETTYWTNLYMWFKMLMYFCACMRLYTKV